MTPLEIETTLTRLRRERRDIHPTQKSQRPADEQAEDLALLLSYALSRMRQAARSRTPAERLLAAINDVRTTARDVTGYDF